MSTSNSDVYNLEISVISDELLQLALLEQAPVTAKVYGKESGMRDNDLRALRLDFRQILAIDNLYSFVNLTKLQLDNNFIEKIENLDHLVKLEWLDLSFNNLTKIEGLSKLTAIKDLSLHHNRITVLEGLDHMSDLDCLSIGDNELPSLEQAPILYMRKFKQLRSISLSGNPLCNVDVNYEQYVIAFLPALRFLNWRRISDDMREASVLRHQDGVELLTLKERDLAEEVQKARVIWMEALRYKEACIPEMNGSRMLDCMLDGEFDKLKVISGIPELFQTFCTAVQARVQKLGEIALAQRAIRMKEQSQLFEAVEEGIQENKKLGSDKVNDWLAEKTLVLSDITEVSGAVADNRLEALTRKLDELKDILLGLEMDIVSQIEYVLESFNINYTSLCNQFLDQARLIMTEMREQEDIFIKESTEISIAFFERYSKGFSVGDPDAQTVISDDLQMILREKQTLTAFIAGVHDNYVLIFDSKEEAIETCIHEEKTRLVDTLFSQELQRNRNRVTEVNNFHHYELEKIGLVVDGL